MFRNGVRNDEGRYGAPVSQKVLTNN